MFRFAQHIKQDYKFPSLPLRIPLSSRNEKLLSQRPITEAFEQQTSRGKLKRDYNVYLDRTREQLRWSLLKVFSFLSFVCWTKIENQRAVLFNTLQTEISDPKDECPPLHDWFPLGKFPRAIRILKSPDRFFPSVIIFYSVCLLSAQVESVTSSLIHV